MNVVLDTCTLLWLTLDPSALSLKAHKALSDAEQLIVSSISVWEIGVKAQRNKIHLGTSYQDYVERLSRADLIELIPVDHRLWMQSVLLDWPHRDPADRVIVALARTLDAPLITEDAEIRSFYNRALW